MSSNNTRRQTFCILVMIMAISMWGGNNKTHTKAKGTRVGVGVGSIYNESLTKALGAREGMASNNNTTALGAREGVTSNYIESHTKALGGREGVPSNYNKSHTKALGAREGVGSKYNETHTKALGAREGVEYNYNALLIVEDRFLQWVKFVGTLKKHSLFGVAKNVFDFKSTFVVDIRPGKGDFKSIQQAVNSVPNFNLFRVVIQINPGIYMEKVSIPWSKPYITFQGAGSNNTIIQWNDTADKIVGGRALGTFNTATVAIDAPYFIATNLTFKNFAPCPAIGAKNKQASAVRVSGDASAFVGCQFLGTQDTLYDHKGRHFFQDCYIEGSVDFIFGDGLSIYKNCHVHAIGARYEESITAQKRASPLEDSGFSFLNCKVTGAGPLYLGRAWGTFSRVVYAYTYMDNIVIPKGWYNWGDPKREGTVYYGQYKCWGPGASAQGRVMWSRELSDEEAQPFLDLTFIDGSEWIGL